MSRKEEVIKLILGYNRWKILNYTECFGVWYKNKTPGRSTIVEGAPILTEEELVSKYLK